MPMMNVEITDVVKEMVDREVATGRFKDAGALVEKLLTRFVWLRDRDRAGGFSQEEKKRIDQMLHEAMDSAARGETTRVRPGEFEELARRLVDQYPTTQAS